MRLPHGLGEFYPDVPQGKVWVGGNFSREAIDDLGADSRLLIRRELPPKESLVTLLRRDRVFPNPAQVKNTEARR